VQKIKITYIVSRVNKSMEFEWVAELLDKDQFELSFILMGPDKNTALETRLNELSIPHAEIKLTGKKNYIAAWLKTRRILKKWKPDIVHCHLIDATLIGLSAAKWLGIKKRMYTRHHSTFHHSYAPQAVKFDKWANRNATLIIAVSSLVKEILVEKEKVKAEKIEVVDHGIDINNFVQVDQSRIEHLQAKYRLKENEPIIGSVARYDEWKGVQYTIAAFHNILLAFPNAKLVLANAGKGDFKNQVEDQLKTLPASSYVEIPYENDMPALFKCIDLMVHVPIDHHSEAFGQVYIEAMAAGVPVIATRSGIGNEILKHTENSYVVGYKNAQEIVAGVKYMMEDITRREGIVASAFQLVKDGFVISVKIDKLTKIYQTI
jgi:glycosyltransferase involved in cell wall biosynthesis